MFSWTIVRSRGEWGSGFRSGLVGRGGVGMTAVIPRNLRGPKAGKKEMHRPVRKDINQRKNQV